MNKFSGVCVLTALVAVVPFAGSGQTVTATLPAGSKPQAIAVNPVSNKIYVANKGSNNVTVVDGATNTATTVATGTSPNSVAVNPITNKIYVANNGSANVTVIDGATNTTSTVPAGTGPYAVAVNAVTNKIYVANYNSNNVTVIDGATNTANTVVAGSNPYALAVNAVTNKIYVANSNGSNVTVIDGASNSTALVPTATYPIAVAVNPVTNKIYITNYGGQPTGNSVVTVIDGATNSATSVPVGRNPYMAAVNPVTNKVYVANGGDAGSLNGGLTVIDGATNAATNPVTDTNLFLVCVNTITNQIYIGYQGQAVTSSVSDIDGTTGALTRELSVGAAISSLAVNPVTNRIYAASSGTSNSITVIDGDTYLAGSPFPAGNGYSFAVAAVNPVTNKIYGAISPYSGNPGNGTPGAAYALYIIDPVSGTYTQLPLSFVPASIVVNPITNKVYASGGNNVIAIDGATNTISLLSSAGGLLALNTVANRIYALNGSSLYVIDGASGAITIVPVPSFAIPAIAVNEVTDKIFITNYNDPGSITVFDGNTNTTSTVAVGAYPVAVAVNPVTNKIYVVSGEEPSTLTVIDGATNIITGTVAAGTTAEAVAVNPFTNRIYVTNYNGGNFFIFDGATLNGTTLTVGNQALQVVVNPVTNQVYISSSNPSVLDGATNFLLPLPSLYLAANLVANQVYISESPNGYPELAVVNEQQTQIQPLNTAITPLPANQTTNPSPTFTFTASSNTSVQPNAVFYQVDTWQGAWTAASGANPTFTATLPSLQPGVHTLYAYAADGGEANPTQPLIGAIQPYQFLYSPALLQQTISFPTIPPQTTGSSFPLTASASSGLPVSFVVSSPQVCQLANGSVYLLSAGTCIVTASQSGSPSYYPASPVTQNVAVTGGMSGTAFISSQVPGRLRNDYSGFVGFTFTVGASPIQVSWLGRFIAPGNTHTHIVKIVQSNGVDFPGGSVTVSTLNAVPGQYQYFPLTTPISLSPNTTYYLVSQEAGSYDSWYDIGPVTANTSVASVTGPVYTNFQGAYITLSPGYGGESYVPLNFLYGPGAASPIAASITSPTAGATLTGSASIVVSTTGAVTALQLQVDGLNRGASVPVSQSSPYTIMLDTTQLTNGTHSLAVIASDAQAHSAYSPTVSITVANSAANSTAFVTGQSLGSLRNNYSGFVGMAVTVANAPLVVSSLGRFVVSGNSNAHLLKLVQANGVDVAGGSVSLSLSSAFAGAYQYAALASPVTLAANTTYYLVSQETAGADQWHDLAPITSTSVASVAGPVYLSGQNTYNELTYLAGQCYVPLSFLYGAATTSVLSATITLPQNGATLSGKTVPVTVTTTGSVTSLQLQVDGTNQGIPVITSPLTLDTTVLTNGPHTLTVVVSSGSNTAVSPGVSVTVNNGAVSTTAFITSQSVGAARNNFSGFVGMAIQVANSPVVVSSLGRFVAPGNSQSHLLKLVQSNGIDLPGGSVSVALNGASAGSYQYAALATSVTLAANTKYYLVSQETAGGDMWYDYGPVNSTSAANVLGPVYTDAGGNYITVSGVAGYAYVPLNLLYGGSANTGNLLATITSPQSGATLSGKTVPVTVTTNGGVNSLQLQVDGTNQGSSVSASPLTLDTTVLSNGQHTLTVVVTGTSSNTAISPAISVTVNNGGAAATTFITSQTPSSPRNNYTGFVGMAITVGASPLTVTRLGRLMLSGDTGTHLLKLVQGNGADVPGGSATVSLAGATAGTYVYAALSSPVTLAANASYYLVSQETAGGDSWYDLEPVTSTIAAMVTGATYSDANGNYVVVGGLPNYSYVTVNFQYQ